MVKQWLKAGVVELGRLHRTEEGTPQGGVISPALLNIALHVMEQAAGARYETNGKQAARIAPVEMRRDQAARHLPHRQRQHQDDDDIGKAAQDITAR